MLGDANLALVEPGTASRYSPLLGSGDVLIGQASVAERLSNPLAREAVADDLAATVSLRRALQTQRQRSPGSKGGLRRADHVADETILLDVADANGEGVMPTGEASAKA